MPIWKPLMMFAVAPRKIPPLRSLRFLRRRQRIEREVDAFEVGGCFQLEITRLADLVAEAVAPTFEAVGSVGDAQFGGLPRQQICHNAGELLIGAERQGLSVHFHHQSIVDGVLGRETHGAGDALGRGGGISDGIHSGKVHHVGAVPEQPALAVVQG